MQLTIDDKEIKDAIIEYVKNQGISTTDKKVSIDLIAGRMGNGHKAEIEITADTSDNFTIEAHEEVHKDSISTDVKSAVDYPFLKEGDIEEKGAPVNEVDDTGSSTAESSAPTSLFSKQS